MTISARASPRNQTGATTSWKCKRLPSRNGLLYPKQSKECTYIGPSLSLKHTQVKFKIVIKKNWKLIIWLKNIGSSEGNEVVDHILLKSLRYGNFDFYWWLRHLWNLLGEMYFHMYPPVIKYFSQVINKSSRTSIQFFLFFHTNHISFVNQSYTIMKFVEKHEIRQVKTQY